jgi:hypothetical protein
MNNNYQYLRRANLCVRHGSQAILALLAVVVCGSAAAQNVHPALTDRWNFQLGAFVPKTDTTLRLDATATVRPGTSLSFEDDLGFSDTKTIPAILASVRLGERWKIEGEYFSLHRSSARAINRTINWGDQTFTVGTVVAGEFDSDIYRLSVGYSFIKNNQAELGAVVGLHVTDFKASLAAAGVGAQTGDGLAPLPTIGLYGAYAFTPQWLVSGRADYFSFNYNEYDGKLINFTLGVDYRFTRHFGAGIAWRHVDYQLDATKVKYTGEVNYKFTGPMVYLNASF